MSLKEKLAKLTDETPSNWLEEAKIKVAHKGARKNARKVALEVLRTLRDRGMTQIELGEKMGVSRQQVTKIVKGKENFTFETIEKLENALGITLMTIGKPEERNVRSTSAYVSGMVELPGNSGRDLVTILRGTTENAFLEMTYEQYSLNVTSTLLIGFPSGVPIGTPYRWSYEMDCHIDPKGLYVVGEQRKSDLTRDALCGAS